MTLVHDHFDSLRIAIKPTISFSTSSYPFLLFLLRTSTAYHSTITNKPQIAHTIRSFGSDRMHQQKYKEAHPVPIMCPGLTLHAQHSASLSSRHPPANCRCTCTLLSALYKHHNAAGAVDTTFFPRRLRQLEPGTVCHQQQELPTHCCNFGERQKHLCSDCHSLTDWKPPLLTVWHCSVQHVLHKFCKVPLQCPWCDSVTLIFAFLIIIIIIIILYSVDAVCRFIARDMGPAVSHARWQMLIIADCLIGDNTWHVASFVCHEPLLLQLLCVQSQTNRLSSSCGLCQPRVMTGCNYRWVVRLRGCIAIGADGISFNT